jgi:probable rRNA maturation factor
MMTLEPPRTLAGKAGKIERVQDAEMWRAWGLSRAGLSRFLRTAQAAVGLEGEVDVLLAGDRMLRRLNREYRGKDKATDVLSFPAAEELGGEHGGDLAISLDTAKRQAEEHGHSLRDEVRVLLLHGLLHLSGMDHETDRGEMAEREDVLRGKLRLPNGLIARVEGGARTTVRITAKATAKTNAGVLRFAQDDGEKQAKAKARATATATAKARAKGLDAKGAESRRNGRDVRRRSGVRA